MYGPRGAMGGGYSGYEGAMRQRMIDSSNPYFAARNTPDASMFSKRARPLDPYPNPYNYPPAPINNYNSNITGSSGSINSLPSFPVVRLRGLPFNSEDLDVYKFFAGLDVVDCLLVNRNGRFSGEAFAVLSSPMQVELALARSGQHIGRRYVEVFKCLKHDYYSAIAEEVVSGGSYEPSPPRPKRSRVTTANAVNALSSVKEEKEKMEYTQVLKLRGLPYSATVSNIVGFFEGFGIEEEKVHIAMRSDGKATGEAYVEFESVEKAKEAMCKDRNMIGSRYVELFPSTVEDMRRAASRCDRLEQMSIPAIATDD